MNNCKIKRGVSKVVIANKVTRSARIDHVTNNEEDCVGRASLAMTINDFRDPLFAKNIWPTCLSV